MTMQQPTPFPTMPKLDPQNPYQMFAYFTSWLYLTEPKALAESDKEIGASLAEFTTIALETGMLALGMRRGNPNERTQAYERKYNWPLQVDQQTGMLLHPVMASQPVYDPATGQPTGQMQQVATGVGEDLWQEQQRKFPRQFAIDALDAVKLGAPVPDWVRAYAEANGVAGETAGPQAPHPVQPLSVDNGPQPVAASRPQPLSADAPLHVDFGKVGSKIESRNFARGN